jgi:hypothetical protein
MEAMCFSETSGGRWRRYVSPKRQVVDGGDVSPKRQVVDGGDMFLRNVRWEMEAMCFSDTSV